VTRVPGPALAAPTVPAAVRGRRGTCAALVLSVLVLASGHAATRGEAAESDATFRADADVTRIGLDDQVQLTITIEGRLFNLKGEVSLPELENLKLLAGPSLSTQFSLVNGSASQSRSYLYVLQPVHVGTARIGPSRAVIDDRERSTAPITLEVVQGRVVQRQPPPDPFAGFRGQDPLDTLFGAGRAPRRDAKLFIEADTDRTTLYVGEPLLLTYNLYTQTAVSGIQLDRPPELQAFWVEELGHERNPRGEQAEREGETFQRFPVLRRLLFPTRPGSLVIPAAGFKVSVPQASFFGPIPGGDAMVARTTRSIPIIVKALPAAPGFAGAVGRFRATTTIDRSTLAVGEAATVRFRVEGTGNLKWIDKGPDLAVAGAKVYPPQPKPEFKVTSQGLVGSLTWEYVVVPETAGAHEVPPLSFAYFDPQMSRLERDTTSAIPFVVAAAGQQSATVVAGGATGTAGGNLAPRGQPHLALRSGADTVGRALPGLTPVALAWVFGLVVLGHGALLAWPTLRLRRGSGSSARGVSARHALAEIAKARRSGTTKEGAAMAIERALAGLFGELDERPADTDGERERELKGILRDLRFLRFAPQLGDYSEKVAEVAARATAAVRRWA
jgi:hypothetical protein